MLGVIYKESPKLMWLNIIFIPIYPNSFKLFVNTFRLILYTCFNVLNSNQTVCVLTLIKW